MKKHFFLIIILVIVFYISNNSYSEEEIKKIQDNSFLVEEAYNQEDGVIQHISYFKYNKDKSFEYSFVEEWPIPIQDHQLSLSFLVQHNQNNNQRKTKLGDLMINYRYQAVFKQSISFSPRISLILPTGDYKNGMGDGTFGFQLAFPLSIDLSKQWVTHWNFGWTFLPKAKDLNDITYYKMNFFYGTSIIFLPAEIFNIMLEFLLVDEENRPIDKSTPSFKDYTFRVNPGVRFAINFDNGLQIVPGVSMPIKLNFNSIEYSIFTYLSFEHPLF